MRIAHDPKRAESFGRELAALGWRRETKGTGVSWLGPDVRIEIVDAAGDARGIVAIEMSLTRKPEESKVLALSDRGRLEIRTDGAFLVYLRKAVNNRIIDSYRRAGRRPERLEIPEDAPANSTSPFDAVVGAEAVDRYDAALLRLTEDERRAIVLRVELGYDYSELAVELGKSSVDAARMAVTRAIAKLALEMRRGQ